jgi:hypothetical protein
MAASLQPSHCCCTSQLSQPSDGIMSLDQAVLGMDGWADSHGAPFLVAQCNMIEVPQLNCSEPWRDHTTTSSTHRTALICPPSAVHKHVQMLDNDMPNAQTSLNPVIAQRQVMFPPCNKPVSNRSPASVYMLPAAVKPHQPSHPAASAPPPAAGSLL